MGCMQRLLNASSWYVHAMRGELVTCACGQPADPAASVVSDETRFLKKGAESTGVKRRHSGTAGKLEKCRIGVFVTFCGLMPAQTRVLVDREPYLPVEWASDVGRRRGAGVPDDSAVRYQAGAGAAHAGANTGGQTAGFLGGGGTAYGGSGPPRAWLEEQH
jgi:hypothetical protein